MRRVLEELLRVNQVQPPVGGVFTLPEHIAPLDHKVNPRRALGDGKVASLEMTRGEDHALGNGRRRPGSERGGFHDDNRDAEERTW